MFQAVCYQVGTIKGFYWIYIPFFREIHPFFEKDRATTNLKIIILGILWKEIRNTPTSEDSFVYRNCEKLKRTSTTPKETEQEKFNNNLVYNALVQH